MRLLPIGSNIWMLGPKVVDYLGNIRKCGLVGGAVSLGVMGGGEVSKVHIISVGSLSRGRCLNV